MRISDWSSYVCSSDLRSTFGANRSVGAAGGLLSERASGVPGVPAFGMGGIDAARELGGLTPALVNGDLSNPAVQRAVRANATTAAIHQFAEKDALRSLGNRYFGEGQAGERAFARSEEHTSELQSLMRISYAVFCLKKT